MDYKKIIYVKILTTKFKAITAVNNISFNTKMGDIFDFLTQMELINLQSLKSELKSSLKSILEFIK